ncbi:hypothetical protein [Methylobacterium sp. ID0610]|uniref:hypothetical protein n=1 Tax=Methylobacterium carpenticola TaxID=3344827 RepID=UPI003673C2CB
MRTADSVIAPAAPEPVAEGRGAAPAWRRFCVLLVGGTVALLAGYLALALAVDPYDTGRPRLLNREGVRPQGPRTASASRGRDPAFTAAIIGNSHIQLITPERLRAQTGIPFVQLAVPATGPGEQLTLAAYFLRHHPNPQALVLAPDAFWCGDDPALPPSKPFPFWLLASDWPDYLRGLVQSRVAAEVVTRIRWSLRPNARRARPDGYWDYEPDYLRQGDPSDPARVAARGRRPPAEPDPGFAGPAFPAAERLRAFAAGLPPETALIAVFPPIYAPAQPIPGTPRAAAAAACRAAIRTALAVHPRHRVIDWSGDRPQLADPAAFFDPTHYRQPIARQVEAEIVAALGALRPEGPRE